MKHYRINHVIILVSMIFLFSCSSSRKFKSSFPAADTIMNNEGSMDSTLVDSAKVNLQSLQKNRIDFQTFSAKIKVNYADVHGSQPEGNVTLRMYKDSAIWISLSGSILNLEIYRLLIKPDSVIILNKLEKTV